MKIDIKNSGDLFRLKTEISGHIGGYKVAPTPCPPLSQDEIESLPDDLAASIAIFERRVTALLPHCRMGSMYLRFGQRIRREYARALIADVTAHRKSSFPSAKVFRYDIETAMLVVFFNREREAAGKYIADALKIVEGLPEERRVYTLIPEDAAAKGAQK